MRFFCASPEPSALAPLSVDISFALLWRYEQSQVTRVRLEGFTVIELRGKDEEFFCDAALIFLYHSNAIKFGHIHDVLVRHHLTFCTILILCDSNVREYLRYSMLDQRQAKAY